MSKRIKGITIEIDGETKGLDKALQGVNKESRNIQKELRDVDRLLKFNPKNTELLAQKQKLLADQVGNTRKKLDELKGAQEQVTKAFENGEISEEQYRAFQREIAETESKLNHYENQLKKVDASQRTFGEKMAESGKKVKEFGQGMQSVGKEMTMKVTTPLVAIGALATKIGSDFRSGLSEVQAISGATAEELDQLEVKARELGAATKFSAKEVTDAFKYMAMAGWDVQQSMDAVDGVLALAAASGEDLGLVADIVTDGMTAFGLAADQAGRFADVLAAASSGANTNVAMLGESFKYVAPVAGALGYSVEDTALALGLMANAGIKSSQAGTALRASLTNLVKPTAKMQKEMDALGINIKDSNGEMKPMETMLRDLRTAFSTLTDDQKASSAATIFGKEAMAGMLAILNTAESDFDKLSKSINNSEGSAQKMADTMQDNLGGQITNLKSALEELAIKIYENLEPALREIVKSIQKVVDKLNNMSPAMQKIVVGVAALVAAIGPLLTVGGTLLVGIGHLMTLLPVLVPLISGLALPIGIVVGAITALGVAYGLTRTKADEALQADLELAENNLKLAESQSKATDEVIKSQEETVKAIDSYNEFSNKIDSLITAHSQLAEKNKLTNEELGEYLSLSTELEMTKSPTVIAEMKDRMEELRVKSGLTKEEFARLLQSNKELTEYFPEAGLAVDEHGNKIAGTTEQLKEMARVELERLEAEIYSKLISDLEESNRLSEQYEQTQVRIFELQDTLKEKSNERLEAEKQLLTNQEQLQSNEEEILRLKELQKDSTFLESMELGAQINTLELQNGKLDRKNEKHQKNIDALDEIISTSEQELGVLGDQHKKTGDILVANYKNYDSLLKIKSEQMGINLEKGKENKAIDASIKKNQEQIKKLEDKKRKEGDSNGELQKQIDKLGIQNTELDNLKLELDNINKNLETQDRKQKDVNLNALKITEEYNRQGGVSDKNIKKKDILIDKQKKETTEAEKTNTTLAKDIKKDVNIKTNKDADEENRKWSKPIRKVIDFFTGKKPDAYAKGTNFHAGGAAFLGEEGAELVRTPGGKFSIQEFGLYDLPTGSKVWTNEQTTSMLRNGLLDGIGRGVNAQRETMINQTINIEPAPIILDGQTIGYATFNTTNQRMGQQQNLDNFMRGV